MIYIGPLLNDFNYDGRKSFRIQSVSVKEVLSLIRREEVKLCHGDSAIMKAAQAHLGINDEIPEIPLPVAIEKGDKVIVPGIYGQLRSGQQEFAGMETKEPIFAFRIYTFK